jgi:AraC-like DNA-binding protein
MLRSCNSLAVIAVETGFANGSRLSAALRRTYDNSPSKKRARVASPPGSADWDPSGVHRQASLLAAPIPLERLVR